MMISSEISFLIHFLQEKHGGDGEVTAHYPTEEDGVALLEFTDEKVLHADYNVLGLVTFPQCVRGKEAAGAAQAFVYTKRKA
ncbi:unnamed protein product [Ranitomeya imitator]|uniref:Uncharacterized protein n=1 Tax=Ranitomeya imitator TaxID=111125 RepID=A0ABN9MGX2_9NEOB|nr:unnamed protein product [Ranitomeya imitator]